MLDLYSGSKRWAKEIPPISFHEYFGAVWTPFFFHEIAAQMDEAKLSFVGSIDMASNRSDLCIPDQAMQHFRKLQTLEDQELFKDCLVNRVFRRDLFIKGERRLTLKEQVQALQSLQFMLTKAREECGLNKVELDGVMATMPSDPYDKLLDALAVGSANGRNVARAARGGLKGRRDVYWRYPRLVRLKICHADSRSRNGERNCASTKWL